MKKNITKGKDQKELTALLGAKRKSLAEFRFNIGNGKTKNVKEGRGIRKEIAQILTSLNA
jgi:ribosomal protein L29